VIYYLGAFVSRQHAIFHRSVEDNGRIRWMIEDLTGGRTFINGFQLTANLKMGELSWSKKNVKHSKVFEL
jgi:hypothetical protein